MEIKPFKAFRFDAGVVGDAGSCISPPYDVISDEQQQKLYEKSEYNVVRIIKGQTDASNGNSSNQYIRAADYFNSWIERGVLKQDPAEAIYAYIQDFELAGEHFQRDGFIALAKLEKLGGMVKPHEYTLEKPKIDRLNLKRATKADFGLVFMLYEDQKQIADKIIENTAGQEPLIDFIDEQNVRHRLFAIKSEEDIGAITKMMSGKSCIIADGHHRYETALNYLKENSNPGAGYQMTAFVNARHGGLVILATHRLVANIENFSVSKLIDGLKRDFEITQYAFDSGPAKTGAKQQMLAKMKAEHDKHNSAFGIYGGNNAFYAAVLKNRQAMDSVSPDKSRAWRELDVSILHKLILEKLLGIGVEHLGSSSNVEYIKDTGVAIDESIAMVDDGQKQAAFFMNPVKMQQLRAVTESGERMPQKSTYFFPKMYSGLVINKL
jgi:uncharacterized protein (DUF1015 family)